MSRKSVRGVQLGRKVDQRIITAVESLENRILLSGGSWFQAMGPASLTLRVTGKDLQLVDTDDPSQVRASTPLGEIFAGVRIDSNGFNVRLKVDASVPKVPGGILFTGAEGKSTLVGPGVDTDWHISGPESGDLGGADYLQFTGVTNLLGATDNKDTFYVSGNGSVGGMIDGGTGGFDSMVLEDSGSSAARFSASGPHSGTVALGNRIVRYDGLEPVTLVGAQVDVVVSGSASDDQMLLEDIGGGMLRVSSGSATPTFESVTFQVPSHSLTIDGLGGLDQINVVNAVNLGSADLVAKAESISVPAGASLTGSGQVSLQALAQNSFSGVIAPRQSILMPR
jgi:hypothetical protein